MVPPRVLMSRSRTSVRTRNTGAGACAADSRAAGAACAGAALVAPAAGAPAPVAAGAGVVEGISGRCVPRSLGFAPDAALGAAVVLAPGGGAKSRIHAW